MGFYTGKTALITGAAQGLGFEIARRFAARGCNIFICDLQAGKLALAHDLIAKTYPNAKIGSLAGDLRDSSFNDRLEVALSAFSDHLDILVNNAGIVFGGAFLERSLAEHKTTYDINVGALVEMTYRFLPRLLKSQEARLVNISSATSLIGLPMGSTYASSKWAVTGFSDSIRLELKVLGHKNVRVKIICPSFITTGLFAGTKAPKFMPPIEPTWLADRIVSYIPSSTVYLKEPFMIKTVRLLQGLLPLWAQDWLMNALGVQTSMIDWKGHKTAKTSS